ncbi:MAG: L,D-transpeptidase family protein [bacterium]
MKKILGLLVCSFLLVNMAYAKNIVDTDADGLSDNEELNLYMTDPNSVDTDADGYTDSEEIKNGYSPINAKNIKLNKLDTDKDGLSDLIEIKLRSKLNNPDSDGDGRTDKLAFDQGFNPLSGKKLIKHIAVNLKKQEIEYSTGSIILGRFRVSTGKKSMPTPKGEYKIVNKSKRAWSKKYGLWMPYWLGMKDGSIGFHELPEWPNGFKEGQNHLGKPVSHGCVRLGIGDAKKLFDWAEVGTPVTIK